MSVHHTPVFSPGVLPPLDPLMGRPAPVSTPKFDSLLSKAALRVYLALRDELRRAELDGTIVFSPSWLAADCGIPRKTMFCGLRDLAQRGHIQRGRRGRFTTARIITQKEAV